MHEEFDRSHGIAPSQHSPELPLVHHSPLSRSDAGKYTNEKEPPYPLESCSQPVSETNCLSGIVANPSQELTTPAATSSAGSLPNAHINNKRSLSSCSTNEPTLDALTLHASNPSDTDVLTYGLQDL